MKKLLFILFPLWATAQLPDPNVYSWQQLSSGMGYSRDGVGGIFLSSKYHLFGGWSAGTTTFKKQFSSADGITWSAEADAPWEPAHTIAYALDAAGTTLYKVDGDYFNFANTGLYDTTTWKTTDAISWSLVSSNNLLGHRWGGQLIFYNGAYYYIGGAIDLTASTAYDEVWKSTDNCATFTRINSSTVFKGGLLWHSVVSYKGRMLKIGGTTYDNDLLKRIYPREIYTSTDGVTWTLSGYMPIKMLGRHYQFLIEFDDLLWLGCGYDSWRGNNIQDVWCSDDGINWIQQAASSMPNRHAQTSYIKGISELIISNGTTNAGGGGSTTADVWKMIHN